MPRCPGLLRSDRSPAAVPANRPAEACRDALDFLTTRAGASLPWGGLTAVLLLLTACDRGGGAGAMVLTQIPVRRKAADSNHRSWLDERYPDGSRVVLTSVRAKPGDVRVLSRGLVAAGSPVVAADGRRVFFAGKGPNDGQWQIYQADLAGGFPSAITAVPGGAMDPAILGNGDVVFSSPVPPAYPVSTAASNRPALYAKAFHGWPRRLTFGSSAAFKPTVLDDGRILFVTRKAGRGRAAGTAFGLYTINNDGTEVTALGLDGDGVPLVHRPRQLPDGRIGFVASRLDPDPELTPGGGSAEMIRLASPFTTRTNLLPAGVRCRSVEPGPDGSVYVCLDTRGLTGRAMGGSFAVFRMGGDGLRAQEPVFDDPEFEDIEAAPLAARPGPQGHLSVMVPGRRTGTLLCLDANFARDRLADGSPKAKAEKVRVLVATDNGAVESLGEVPLQADGSFMADVPADAPLGFETLTARGEVVHRLAPSIWVRPGENRSCVGCHEPYNRSPRNQRPAAVNSPPAELVASPPCCP